MAQVYSDPTRETNPHALPDVEVFYLSAAQLAQIRRDNGATCADDELNDDDLACYSGGPGWYYWYCLPGCMPDSEPCGPFATESAAVDAMRADAPEPAIVDGTPADYGGTRAD